MKRTGVTLVELTIVLALILLLMYLTLGFAFSHDGAEDAANQIVGAMQGSKDRAAQSGERRGLKPVVKPGETFATGLVRVGGPDTITPTETLETVTTGNVTTLRNLPPVWADLERSGALDPKFASVTISGSYYGIKKVGSFWQTTRRVAKPFDNHKSVAHTIGDMHPIPLQNADVVQLPRGIVIDLDESVIPPQGILFRPNGRGVDIQPVFLVITSPTDAALPVGSPKKESEEFVIAILPDGRVSIHEIDGTDNNGNGIADDPFNYAHLGIER